MRYAFNINYRNVRHAANYKAVRQPLWLPRVVWWSDRLQFLFGFDVVFLQLNVVFRQTAPVFTGQYRSIQKIFLKSSRRFVLSTFHSLRFPPPPKKIKKFPSLFVCKPAQILIPSLVSPLNVKQYVTLVSLHIFNNIQFAVNIQPFRLLHITIVLFWLFPLLCTWRIDFSYSTVGAANFTDKCCFGGKHCLQAPICCKKRLVLNLLHLAEWKAS